MSHTATCDQISGHTHPASPGPVAEPTRPAPAARWDEAAHRRAAHRAVGVSALGLGCTGLLELALALLTGSVALLSDALHNLSDVSTSAVVYASFQISKKPPSSRYPYGYERAEDLAGLGVALVIWASAGFAGVESYRKLVGSGQPTSVFVGIAGAALGIVGNQCVARYKLRVGRQIHSATLIADARHSWLDALSSAGALGGLALVAAGVRWGDPVAGLAVTVFIAHVGWHVTGELLHHLMDGADPAHLHAAAAAARAVPGVHAATVRGRWTGRSLLLDVDGTVDPTLTVAQATHLGQAVETAVLEAVEQTRAIRWTPHPWHSSPNPSRPTNRKDTYTP